MIRYDVIVAGLGAMGAAACWRLARRGLRVLGLEQYQLAHDLGSSHGQTRIIRMAYFEHPDYVPLLRSAYQLWDELESENVSCATREHTPLFERCGLLLAGPGDGVVVSGTRRAAELHGLPLESLAAEDVRGRFSAFRVPDDLEVIFEADAGLLRVEACVASQLAAARRAGAEIRANEPLLDWSSDADTVSITTRDGRYTAQRLVLTTGPWSGPLLRELGVPLQIERRVQLWFPAIDPALKLSAGCPVYGFQLGQSFFYGFPDLGCGEIKAALHTRRDPITGPDALDRGLRSTDAQPVIEFVNDLLPGAGPSPARHSVCMYSMTPDEHFVIDRHPERANVIFAAGFSGHGFKFAPLVGELLAELAIDGRARATADFLSLKRFAPAG